MKTEKTILNTPIIEGEKMNFDDIDNELDYEKKLKIEASKALKMKQQNQMADMRDTQYYAVVCFANKNDKDEWLKTLNTNISIEGDTFIDGYEFAENQQNIKIECTASLPEPFFAKNLKIKKNKSIKLK